MILRISKLALLRSSTADEWTHEINPSSPPHTIEDYECEAFMAVGDIIEDVLIVGYGPATVRGRSHKAGRLVVRCEVKQDVPGKRPSEMVLK